MFGEKLAEKMNFRLLKIDSLARVNIELIKHINYGSEDYVIYGKKRCENASEIKYITASFNG